MDSAKVLDEKDTFLPLAVCVSKIGLAKSRGVAISIPNESLDIWVRVLSGDVSINARASPTDLGCVFNVQRCARKPSSCSQTKRFRQRRPGLSPYLSMCRLHLLRTHLTEF